MGACCTRNELTGSEILNSPNKNESDIIDSFRYLDLYFDVTPFDNRKVNAGINELQSTLGDKQIKNMSRITFPEIWNISLLYKENHTNSNYLIYDLRPHNLQKENSIKKMRHINYSFFELKLMNHDKIDKFKKFISGKTIIFILPNEKIDTCLTLINFLYDLDNTIKINILNTTLIQEDLSPLNKKLYYYLEGKNYELLPYILFTNPHLSSIRKEGYIFLNYENEENNKFTLVKKGDNNSNTYDTNEFMYGFLQNFQISSIVHIISDLVVDAKELQISCDSKSESTGTLICKEFFLGNGIKGEFSVIKDKFIKVCTILKKEIIKGKSLIFTVNEKNFTKNDYMFTLIGILHNLIPVDMKKLVQYLELKCIYINDCKNRIMQNLSYIQSMDF